MKTTMTMMIRLYQELRRLETFEERFRYLELKGVVGECTFGHNRYANQKFYTSREWRDLRHDVIVRDLGCDLGIEGYEIFSRPIIHHMNPISMDDIVHRNDDILNPNYLITTTHKTHNAIHYGDESLLRKPFVERRPGDTLLWPKREVQHGL